MNSYGRNAQSYWRRWLPERYAGIDDPESFFTELGRQVEQQVGDLWDALRVKDTAPPDESHEQRVGRFEALKRQAEETVLAEMVFLPPEPGTSMDEDEGFESDESFAQRLEDFDDRLRWRSETADALLDDRMTLDDLTDEQLRDIVEYLTPGFLAAFGTSVEELREQGRAI